MDGFGNFRHELLELFLGEVVGLQLLGHFLQRLLGGLRLSVLQLLRQIFAQFGRLLLLELLHVFGQVAQFFQIGHGGLQIF